MSFEEKNNSKYARAMGQSWLPPGQDTNKFIELQEIPVMYLADDTIVCIPKLPEMGLIAVVGLTGTGKTLVSGYINDNIFYLWGDYLSVLNDSQEETFSWSEPCDVDAFTKIINKMHQKPMPLPMVYLFPNSDSFRLREELIKNKNSIVISLPFEEVIENIEKYLPSLGNSLKYIIEKKNELIECQTEDEIFEIIDSIDTGSKGMKESKHKIEASFRGLINEGILNVTNKSSPAYLTTINDKREIYTGNPFTAIMKAECVPSFITSDLYGGRYKDAIFSYYIDSLVNESMKGAMKGKRVWVYFDELAKVVNVNPRENNFETERALNNIASRGRNNGICLIYATQNYNQIPKVIRSQTKYTIAFRHKDLEQAKMICDDFGISNFFRKEIVKLKKHEAVAATTEYFICYKGKKRWKSQGPFMGYTFPSLHKNKFVAENKVKNINKDERGGL